MEIQICPNKQEWDNWELARKPAEFLQSWDWGEFQRATGKDVLRLQMIDGWQVVRQAHHRVVWQGQGFVHKLGMGMKYLYMPRMENVKIKMENLFVFLRDKEFAFVRVEPCEELKIMNYELKTTKNRQPHNTLVLDINKTGEELMTTMHEKTRYNIRLAEKKGVMIKSDKNAEVFWQLNLATTARDKFKSHQKEYYKKMLEFDFCHQLTAYYPFDSAQGKPIAAILLIVFGDAITYLHGVSGNTHRNLMAPYLLQWEGIKLGKKLGCEYYDFGGIAPDAKTGVTTRFNNLCWPTEHRWTGITRFKAGFGGERRDYPGAFDVVLNKRWYGVYQIMRKLVGYK